MDHFFHSQADHLTYSVPLIRKLSPASLSIMEFKSELDMAIAEKLMRHPLLGQQVDGSVERTIRH